MFIMRYKICTGFFVKPGNKREGVGSVCVCVCVCVGGGAGGGGVQGEEGGSCPAQKKKKIIEISIYSSSMDWL